jgi:CheY-like chemotaxis protein
MEQPTNDMESNEAQEALAQEVSRRMGALLSAQGIPPHQQAGLLTQLCGLSPSQARRKLQGANWSFAEVLSVARHFGVSLDTLFPASDSTSPSSALAETSQALIAAVFRLPGANIPCRMRLGAQKVGPAGKNQLFARQAEDGWVVGLAEMPGNAEQGPLFHADEVILTPPSRPRTRIAILDDDPASSAALADWFNAAGYEATAFTACEQLLASNLASHDAFVVDFLLAGGDSSQKMIATIRQQLPDAPVLLLTGKLRDGAVSEADLTGVLRTANVAFFEKPVRPSVLAATLQSSLDRLSQVKNAR